MFHLIQGYALHVNIFFFLVAFWCEIWFVLFPGSPSFSSPRQVNTDTEYLRTARGGGGHKGNIFYKALPLFYKFNKAAMFSV